MLSCFHLLMGYTLERLEAAIGSRNLTLFAQIDHSDLARGAGLTMQEAHVLIFGNPKGGTPLMIASPLLALDLPLKVLVWQSADGQVWVSTNSGAYLGERYALPQELVGNLAVAGFVIERLPTPAPLAGGKTQPSLVSWAPFSAVVGTSLTLLGLALLNFLHIRADIGRDAFHPPVRFVVLLTILASLIGLLLAVYLILTV